MIWKIMGIVALIICVLNVFAAIYHGNSPEGTNYVAWAILNYLIARQCDDSPAR